MKALLLKEAGDATDKLVFAIESRYGAQVDQGASLDEGIAKAAKEPYDLVILDLPSSGASALTRLAALKPSPPVILCQDSRDLSSTVDPQWNVMATVDRSNLVTGIFSGIDSLAQGPKADSPVPDSKEDFCRIRTQILIGVYPLKGDIFIRLSRDKFVKLFHEGDVFDQQDLRRYTAQKGIEYLFIKRDQCGQFLEKYRQDLEKKLGAARAIGLAEAAAVQNSVHETAQEMGRRIGFTKDVQLLAKTQIRIAVKALKSSKNLKSLIDSLERNPNSYISSHSTLTGFISSAIAAQLDWGSDATMYKLNLAAFLHDITLESQDLARCSTLKETEENGYSRKDRDSFAAHPIKAAELARDFSEVPPDVDAIILQHHEKGDGSGFPRGIGQTHISPLSAIFIVAHEMAQRILSTEGPFDIEGFASECEERYPSGSFRKVVAALREIRLSS